MIATALCVTRWMHSFLVNPIQQVKIGNSTSTVTSVNGGRPRSIQRGSYIFFIQINDVMTGQSALTFSDDVTLIQIVDRFDSSHQSA